MKRLVISLSLVMVLLMVLAVPALAAAPVPSPSPVPGSQTWYLSDQLLSGTNAKIMYRETSLPLTGSVTISPGAANAVVWVSNETPFYSEGVTFPGSSEGNTWSVLLKTPADWRNTCTAEIGTANSSGNFDPFPNQDIQLRSWNKWGTQIMEVVVTMDSQTVPNGSYLALRITNTSASDKVITTDGNSMMSSPDSDPGYPLPEVAAGILFGVGAAGVFGFMVIRRRKANKLA